MSVHPHYLYRAHVSIPCSIILVDSKMETRLSRAMNAVMILNERILYFIDFTLSQNPVYHGNSILRYRLKDLEGLYVAPEVLNRMAFRFKKPKHQVMVLTEDYQMMRTFLQKFSKVLKRNNILIKSLQNFQPDFNSYLGTSYDEIKSLAIDNLNKLLLENIILPSGPFNIDQKFVTHLSLNGSSFGSTSQENSFWDWIVISFGEKLTCLEMNNMKLKILPFDIVFMKNLKILSVANNDLTFIPHFIGELDNIKSLYVNDNKLTFLPRCIQTIIFENLNFSNNNITVPLLHQPKNFINNFKLGTELRCKTLSDLSLRALINSRKLVSRKNIPNGLWNSLYSFSRCSKCFKIVMPDDCFEFFIDQYVNVFNIMKPIARKVPIQFFKCRLKCN